MAASRCMSTVTFRSASQTRDSRAVGSHHLQQKKAFPGGSFPVAFFGFRKDSVAHSPVGLFILSGSDLCIAVVSECLGVSHASNGNMDSCGRYGLSAPCTTTGSWRFLRCLVQNLVRSLHFELWLFHSSTSYHLL